MRFRKSAAKMIGENGDVLHQFMGLSRKVGVLSGWFDNLDLQVFTSNGRRTTHAMVQEIQQYHPAGILETGRARPGQSTLAIQWLGKSVAYKSCDTGSLPLEHYTGPTKVLPPEVPKTCAIPYLEAKARQESLMAAEEKDLKWLNQLYIEAIPIEWAGFNTQLVTNAVYIGEQTKAEFISNLPGGFHDTISSPVKSMEVMAKGVQVENTTIYDMETIFLRLLTIGQARQMELAPYFNMNSALSLHQLLMNMGASARG